MKNISLLALVLVTLVACGNVAAEPDCEGPECLAANPDGGVPAGSDVDDLRETVAGLAEDNAALLARLEALEVKVAAGPKITVRKDDTHGPIPSMVHTGMVVYCEDDEVAIGGGAGMTGNAGFENMQQSWPVDAEGRQADEGERAAGWFSIIKNEFASGPQTPIAYAICLGK